PIPRHSGDSVGEMYAGAYFDVIKLRSALRSIKGMASSSTRSVKGIAPSELVETVAGGPTDTATTVCTVPAILIVPCPGVVVRDPEEIASVYTVPLCPKAAEAIFPTTSPTPCRCRTNGMSNPPFRKRL